MPVYDQSYRTYQGAVRGHGRWLVIAGQELRVVFSRRMFKFLLLLGNFHIALRVLQVVVLDVLAKPGVQIEGLGPLEGVEVVDVGAWLYFDFLRLQAPLLFLTLVYAGSSLICNDFRNNLMEIYFSKPINWRDYVVGKLAGLVAIGLALTALPALFLALLHVMSNPEWTVVRESLSYIPEIVAFSLLTTGSVALVVLASSSLVESAKFAGSIVFLLVFVNLILAGAIAGLLSEQNYLVMAFPVSLNNIGEALFHENRYQNPITVPWHWSAAYVAVVWAGALSIICRKVRRAELGR